MNRQFLTFFELIYPFAISFVLLVFIPFFKIKGEINIPVKLFQLDFKVPVYNAFVLRFVWLIVAAVVMCLPAFRDYSKYFPTHCEMEVFFDNEGLLKAIRQFSPDRISSFNIPEDWYDYKRSYFDRINATVRGKGGTPDFFNGDEASVYGEGEAKISMENLVGWQKYHIRDATATVALYAEARDGTKGPVLAKLALQKTSSNYVDLGFADLYYRFTTVINPAFRSAEKINAGDDRLEYDSLIAVTRLRFFPIIKVGDTVLFVRDAGRKSMIPIAYVIYKPQ